MHFIMHFGDPSCYSADTEVLTEQGFMAHADWHLRIRVATFDPEKREIKFHEPDALHVFDYQGEMVHFRNAQTDILVTPSHRMWTAPQTNWKLLAAGEKIEGSAGRPRIADGGECQLDRSWRFSEARDLVANPRPGGWRFEAAASFHAPDEEFIDTPLGRVEYAAFARFLGYFLSEGSTLAHKHSRYQYRIQLAQREGAIAEKMRDTLRALGIQWTETANQNGCRMLTFNRKSFWSWLREHCGTNSHDKRIPNFLLLAGDNIRRELFDGLMEGDGGASGACTRYSSVSKSLADGMQQLALSLGYGAAVSLETRVYKDAPNFIWRVWIRTEWTETKIRPQHVSLRQYEGKVYCFHLPNHIYVTRRNGKLAIQGGTLPLRNST